MEQGDYGKSADGSGDWWVRLPGGPHPGTPIRISSKIHKFTEHEDGTITVSPSMLCSYGDGTSWHGFLEKGVWRTC